ncbi:hypothetical protein LMG22037_06608 [Paraburkholderia phenoliruptrix]|uniref:Uncharacterized protein n=1 Tax=Paraburkholderia phenoliruptrix TaxID=252970 RepID=A0A6J5CS55_9BURK|nr:hypothetical protein LMG22037_06608 [Paraburkholderia phenoliruptrix]
MMERQHRLSMLVDIVGQSRIDHLDARLILVQSGEHGAKPDARGHVMIALGEQHNNFLMPLEREINDTAQDADGCGDDLRESAILVENVTMRRRHRQQAGAIGVQPVAELRNKAHRCLWRRIDHMAESRSQRALSNLQVPIGVERFFRGRKHSDVAIRQSVDVAQRRICPCRSGSRLYPRQCFRHRGKRLAHQFFLTLSVDSGFDPLAGRNALLVVVGRHALDQIAIRHRAVHVVPRRVSRLSSTLLEPVQSTDDRAVMQPQRLASRIG